jgi:hypothetical protein
MRVQRYQRVAAPSEEAKACGQRIEPTLRSVGDGFLLFPPPLRLGAHDRRGPDFESGASAMNVALETGWADS